jgi:hypothetical protein
VERILFGIARLVSYPHMSEYAGEYLQAHLEGVILVASRFARSGQSP